MQRSFQYSTYEEYEANIKELEEFLSQHINEDRSLILYSIREAVNNAFEHGMKEDSSLSVRLDFLINNKQITVEVEHNGKGFNYQEQVEAVQEPDEYLNEKRYENRGRGIAIMKKCAEALFYTSGGRKLTLVFRLEKKNEKMDPI